LSALGLIALFVIPPAPAAAQRVGGIGRIGGVGRIGGFGRIGGIGRVGGFGRWGRVVPAPRFYGRGWRAGYFAPRARFARWSGYGPSGSFVPRRFYRRAWRDGSYYPNIGPAYGYEYPVYCP
jgi:hypothetical protein